MSGSKHIEFLLDNKLIVPKPSQTLDELYSTGKAPFDHTEPSTEKPSTSSGAKEEKMVLHKSNGSRIVDALQIPELNIELDRAVWQVEKALQAEKELKEEKIRLDTANSESKAKK